MSKNTLISRSGRLLTERDLDYRLETPSRDGFVVAWPPQRHWRPVEKTSQVTSRPLHLYFHIPFCLQRCRYCFFKVGILSENSHEVREAYVDALCKEVEMVADAMDLRGRRVRSIYFGGGTPSVLSPEQLARVKKTIDAHFVLDDPEFVFEIEPVTFSNRLIDSLPDLGVNRISFGVQSFDDRVVALTGRHDTEEKNCRAIERALGTGAVVNIDLLSGLEGETEASWRHSVNRATGLGVHAITMYKLELYSNAEYMEGLKHGKLSLPNNQQELEFARYGIEQFQSNGYLPSTYFTFTREGKFPQRHIISRWRGEDMYGFGASAFGSINNESRQNVSEIDDYLKCIKEGEIPLHRSLKNSSLDNMMRDVIMGLKTTTIDLSNYHKRHGIRLESLLSTAIEFLVSTGLLYRDGEKLHLTQEGIIYGDYCGRYLGAGLRNIMTGEQRPLRA
ncbi:MAG: coproporphyrinogen III oxidase family protein [Arenicella sp.]|nr:coproporphyrinogen III oxidase family protein [Arenicella sp.]